jgi:hypothetical protein
MDDKKILYQMLSREIENMLSSNPMFKMFSGPITNWVISYIDPYVDAFYMGTQTLNTDAAEQFVKRELDEKVSAFVSKFKNEQQRQ